MRLCWWGVGDELQHAVFSAIGAVNILRSSFCDHQTNRSYKGAVSGAHHTVMELQVEYCGLWLAVKWKVSSEDCCDLLINVPFSTFADRMGEQ